MPKQPAKKPEEDEEEDEQEEEEEGEGEDDDQDQSEDGDDDDDDDAEGAVDLNNPTIKDLFTGAYVSSCCISLLHISDSPLWQVPGDDEEDDGDFEEGKLEGGLDSDVEEDDDDDEDEEEEEEVAPKSSNKRKVEETNDSKQSKTRK